MHATQAHATFLATTGEQWLSAETGVPREHIDSAGRLTRGRESKCRSDQKLCKYTADQAHGVPVLLDRTRKPWHVAGAVKHSICSLSPSDTVLMSVRKRIHNGYIAPEKCEKGCVLERNPLICGSPTWARTRDLRINSAPRLQAFWLD